jgi:hypothetical protein
LREDLTAIARVTIEARAPIVSLIAVKKLSTGSSAIRRYSLVGF